MSIERNFSIAFISSLALKEKQIQQNYRPIIAVHKWFARRPGTLFRGLILSEFGHQPVQDIYYLPHHFPGKTVADPFMGGGTPLLEANRVGCDVIGIDINPMSAWIVREEIEHLDLATYKFHTQTLLQELEQELLRYYLTKCLLCGNDVPTKYFLWVKVQNCQACGKEFNLFPGYLLAEDERHPLNVLVCSFCGELNEVVDLHDIESCKKCNSHLEVAGPAKRTRCPCPYCNHLNVYPIAAEGVPRHRMFALEYFCPHCKPTHKGRFFKKPDADDLARFQEASRHFETVGASFVPEEDILPGDETDRLHRWGYRRYRDLFNARQLLSLELSCRIISAIPNQRAKRALATNLSDLLRYQNMLCRYDTMALKSLDIFSIHGFPVGLVQCESNFLGIKNGKGLNVGSGGWSNIIDKYAKAKEYCFHPFEILHRNSRKIRIPIIGEWIGERVQGVVESEKRSVRLLCQDAAKAELPAGSLDAVFTDPPYFGNVQYGELMDFCYVWLRRLMGGESEEGLKKAITRDPKELTGNVKMERGLEYFTEGLSQVFSKMAQALKPGAPLVFTYHHNRLEAYYAVGVAILDAGLACTAALPCPAEMGGSIHIYGTSSSIVDTIFVCRAPGYGINQGIFETPEELVVLVSKELNQLRAGGLNPSQGDIRCIISGHLTRMAVHKLRESWDSKRSTGKKLKQLAGHISELSLVDRVIEMVMDYGKNSEDIILRKRII